MTMSEPSELSALRADWDACYRAAPLDVPVPAAVLRDYAHLLPVQGQALDLACGRGGNAWFLAQHGLHVDAWDLSPVVIAQLQDVVRERHLDITSTVRDVLAQPPAALGYDVITVSYFLERSLAPALMAALRPGGLLFYQTFGPERINEHGPRNPAYRLEAGELLRMFAALSPRLYREEGRLGNPQQGLRGEVMFIGERPAVR